MIAVSLFCSSIPAERLTGFMPRLSIFDFRFRLRYVILLRMLYLQSSCRTDYSPVHVLLFLTLPQTAHLTKSSPVNLTCPLIPQPSLST